MKLLIPTQPDDTHAILVKLALEAQGHRVTLMFTADYPTRQKNSVFIDAANYRWQSIDRQVSLVDNDYDVVWWRRPRAPYLPKALVHPDDHVFAVRENMLFYESLMHNLAPNAWWINPKESAKRANFKLLQLKLASECNLNIPTTLCSNDPHEINCFLLKHQATGVIYKPLCANFWLEETRMKSSYTSKVHFLTLPDIQTLQTTPGIFQTEIKKKHELRITCFGHWMVAAKLDSQCHPNGEVDWRAINDGSLQVEPYVIPQDLQIKIRHFMQKIGILFGSFDFIVTQENEYVFLEVNEQGQFFWVEEYAPEIKMLDIFVQFILARKIDFTWDPGKMQHAIADYRAQLHHMYLENMQHHVDLNNSLIYKEQQGCAV